MAEISHIFALPNHTPDVRPWAIPYTGAVDQERRPVRADQSGCPKRAGMVPCRPRHQGVDDERKRQCHHHQYPRDRWIRCALPYGRLRSSSFRRRPAMQCGTCETLIDGDMRRACATHGRSRKRSNRSEDPCTYPGPKTAKPHRHAHGTIIARSIFL